MGGSDSKDEKEQLNNQINQAAMNNLQSIIGRKNKDAKSAREKNKINSPRNNNSQLSEHLNNKTKKNSSNKNHFEIDQQQLSQQQKQEMPAFDFLESIYQEPGELQVKVQIVSLRPTFRFENLNKNSSVHNGSLTWTYLTEKIKGEEYNFLEFIFGEDDKSELKFVMSESGRLHEGDVSLWEAICPFKNSSPMTKVGQFLCQSVYTNLNEEEQIQFEEEISIDESLYAKWEEQVPTNHIFVKQSFQDQRKQHKQNASPIQYREISKYFTPNDQKWAFTVLVEEKNGNFTGWIIQVQDPNQKQDKQDTKIMGQNMRITLENDMLNREKMFIKEMRRKKNELRQKQRR